MAWDGRLKFCPFLLRFSQSYDTFGSFTFNILIMSPLGGKRAGTGRGMEMAGEWCGLCVV